MNIKCYCNNLINNFTNPIFGALYWFCRVMHEFCARNCLKYRCLSELDSNKIVTMSY